MLAPPPSVLSAIASRHLSSTRLFRTCSCSVIAFKSLIRLLVVLLLERLAFFAIVLNFNSYTRYYLDYSSSSAIGMLFVVWGSVYVFAPVFGVITDRKTGHFATLVSAFAVYLAGSVPILYSSSTTISDSSMKVTDISLKTVRTLYLVGVGLTMLSASAIRSTLMPFMVEQLGDGHSKRTLLIAFSSWAYLIVNTAMAIVVGLGSYLQRLSGYQKTKGRHTTGFFWLYLIPPCALTCALCILFVWRKSFKSPMPMKNSNTHSGPGILNVLKTAFGCFHDPNRPLYYDPDALPVRNEEDRQKYKTSIERQKLAVLLPILASLIPFFMVYCQMYSSFAEQALQLDLSVGLKYCSSATV